MSNLALCRSENKLQMHNAPALNLLPAIAGKNSNKSRLWGCVMTIQTSCNDIVKNGFCWCSEIRLITLFCEA